MNRITGGGMNIGEIGSGIVSTTLASGFLQHGHEVVVGSRAGKARRLGEAESKLLK